MQYKYNSIGQNFSDRNGCFVKALALALDVSYRDIYIALADLGRKRNHATPWVAIRAILNDLGLTREQADSVSLVKWVENHRDGSYIVLTCNHALAVIDGVVVDSLHSRPRCKV